MTDKKLNIQTFNLPTTLSPGQVVVTIAVGIQQVLVEEKKNPIKPTVIPMTVQRLKTKKLSIAIIIDTNHTSIRNSRAYYACSSLLKENNWEPM
jgi:hypothetical protein